MHHTGAINLDDRVKCETGWLNSSHKQILVFCFLFCDTLSQYRPRETYYCGQRSSRILTDEGYRDDSRGQTTTKRMLQNNKVPKPVGASRSAIKKYRSKVALFECTRNYNHLHFSASTFRFRKLHSIFSLYVIYGNKEVLSWVGVNYLEYLIQFKQDGTCNHPNDSVPVQYLQ